MINEPLVLEFIDALCAGASEESVDAIRDRLDINWEVLGDEDRLLYGKMMSHLGTLQIDSDFYLRMAEGYIRQQRPWVEVLDALRMCHPFRVEHHKRLALLRAQAWRGLGYDLVAERFERHAATLERETP